MQPRDSAPFVASETTDFQKQPLKQCSKAVAQPEEPAARCEASQIREHRVELPDPEYRYVAGHVRRKTGNTVRADPPPSHPPQTSSMPANRRPNQKKKASNRPGNGSGSDSDTDSDSNGRPKRDGHGISGARRRAADPSDASEARLHNRAAAIEREESDRMKLFQTLQQVTHEWHHVHRHRRDNHEAVGEKRRQILLRRHDKMTGQWSPSSEIPGAVTAPSRPGLPQEDSAGTDRMILKIRQWEMDYRVFLDKALRSDIEQKLLEESQSGEAPVNPLDCLEDVLGRVETNVIVCCRQFAPSGWGLSSSFQNVGLGLVGIVKALYHCLWIHLSQAENEASDVVAAATAFVKENCPDQAFFQDTDALTTAYMARIVEGLVEAVMRDRSTAQPKPDAESLGLVQIIGKSRNDGRMTAEYMAWMCSDVEANVVEQSCLQWQKGLKAEAVDAVHVAMKGAAQQKLCQGIIRPGVVSLVLFKGNSAQTIRDVSASELMRMGWFYQSFGPSGSTYWRHKIYARNSWDSRGVAFMVSMDEEILGMWMPNGTFYWDEVLDETGDDQDA